MARRLDQDRFTIDFQQDVASHGDATLTILACQSLRQIEELPGAEGDDACGPDLRFLTDQVGPLAETRLAAKNRPHTVTHAIRRFMAALLSFFPSPGLDAKRPAGALG